MAAVQRPARRTEPPLPALGDDVDVGFLCQLFGLQSRRVYQLIESGVIPRPKSQKRGKYRLTDAITGYIRFLQESTRSGKAGDTLNAERARLAKGQADRVELQNAVTRGELLPSRVIEEVVAKIAAEAALKLEALPVLVKRRLSGVDPKVVTLAARVVEDETVKVRARVAEMSISVLDETDEAEESDNDEGYANDQ